MKFSRLVVIPSVLAISVLSAPAQAYEPKKDWPCIQVKVPELSHAMMW